MADYAVHRPRGFKGQNDSCLPKMVRKLKRTLAEAQDDFAYDTLRLPSWKLGELACILVDFAEDLHAGTGIWAAYERYNVELFGAALPLTAAEGGDLGANRFRYFLWILYPAIIDNLILSPTHQDIRRIADAAAECLSDTLADIPKDSGVKTFLSTPNDRGWDVKRKLVWLGTHSFMFRTMFASYIRLAAHGKADIPHTDDFLCQECTHWSGLGVVDVLAGALAISEDERRDLRSWYERHAAFYKLLSVGGETLEAVNLVNDHPYRIRIDMKQHPFKRGQVVFGSVVPWRGEWYWSGESRLMGDASKVDADDLKRTMKRQGSAIVCRYSKEYEALVRDRMAAIHKEMLAFHGGEDLVVYPDGLAMAADWQKEVRWQWESRPQKEVDEVVRKYGLKERRPDIQVPRDLLEEKDGLGVFLNPDEGKEIMTHFTTLVAGLRKKGEGLTGDEADSIRAFVESPSVSPSFVRRVLEAYGDESVKEAFVLRGELPGYWLDWLLRSRKGHYYRKCYPSLSVL